MKRLLALLLLILYVSLLADAKCGIKTTHRSKNTAHRFMVMTGYPHGRPGWIVDHVWPLCKGGPDVIENMQWQTVADAKAKDKWECLCTLTPRKP